MTRPLANVAIVGYGKAGGSLGASLQAAGVVVHVVSRNQRRREAAQAVHRRPAFESAASLLADNLAASLDALFLAVPDAHIEAVAQSLDDSGALPPIVAHLSGARGREAIGPHLRDPSIAAAFHPLVQLSIVYLYDALILTPSVGVSYPLH